MLLKHLEGKKFVLVYFSLCRLKPGDEKTVVVSYENGQVNISGVD